MMYMIYIVDHIHHQMNKPKKLNFLIIGNGVSIFLCP